MFSSSFSYKGSIFKHNAESWYFSQQICGVNVITIYFKVSKSPVISFINHYVHIGSFHQSETLWSTKRKLLIWAKF